jgi:cytochrome P450
MDAPHAPAVTSAPRRFETLPGPRGVPVVGNLLQIDAPRMHLQLERWAAQYGPVFRLRLGPRRAVVVSDHEAIAAALRDRPDGFRRSTKFEEVFTGMGLPGGVFGANGDAWKRQRRMVMAGLDPSHVKRFFPSLQRVSRHLVDRWRTAARGGATIDLQADLMRYTVDVIAGLAFGAEVDTLLSDGDVIQQHLNRIFPMLFRRLLAPLPTWRWFPDAQDRALVTSVAEVKAAVAGFVAQARARLAAEPQRREHPANVLEAMIVAAEDPGSGLDDDDVAGNVVTLMLAGEDTTANTIAWMVWLLWQNPAALAKAVAEVRGICTPGAAPTLEQVARLDYVEACAHETMRLKPVAPQNVLQALRPTTVAGVTIEPGMLVLALMRRDPTSERHVAHADAFEPERWLEGGAPGAAGAMASSAKRLSMPFGAGPRICPGRYLALLEMKMAMAELLGEFDIADVGTLDGQPPREKLQLAMAPVGLTMRVRERAPSTSTSTSTSTG